MHPEYQAETIELVEKGVCKIVYATASASNGIDFPGIRRIIQYGVNANLLDFCAWVQRMGRAGRCDDDEQCVAIIYAPARYLLSRLPQPGTALENELGKFRDAINTPGSDLLLNFYKSPENRKKGDPPPKKDGLNQDNRKRSPLEMMKDLDPMLLWFLNTTGCRRHLLLKYFADPKGDQQNTTGFICCDVCSRERIAVIGGVQLRMTLTNYFAVKAAPKWKLPNEKLVNTTQAHKVRAEALIRDWRDNLWKDKIKFPINFYTPSTGLLDDGSLQKLAAKAARITTVGDIRGILGSSCGWESSIFKLYGVEFPLLSLALRLIFNWS